MNRKLLLFWQNTETRRWFTVGLLEFINDEYSFKYSKSAHKAFLEGDFMYRLRCSLEAVWPDGFSTFADDEFDIRHECRLLKVAT